NGNDVFDVLGKMSFPGQSVTNRRRAGFRQRPDQQQVNHVFKRVCYHQTSDVQSPIREASVDAVNFADRRRSYDDVSQTSMDAFTLIHCNLPPFPKTSAGRLRDTLYYASARKEN